MFVGWTNLSLEETRVVAEDGGVMHFMGMGANASIAG